ncbi:LOW QUALITY PROTEIN: antiviral innate immune response receptor RIG-I-like [Lineus longissimus]|uniref:LOW QUALITY PROTEIN: antiviral innate immune response receptor RIG-I-like n=1 Tax=Lineus longissimus TaxID=88925 RepID=UPI00315C7F7D
MDLYEEDLPYKALITVFSPSIEKVLEPKDILPSFPDWPDAERETIRSKPTAPERARAFIAYLIRDEEPFTSIKFTQFLDALSGAEYVPLRKILDGGEHHHFDVFMKILRIFEAEIERHIVIDTPLLNLLMEDRIGLLSEHEKEEVLDFVDRGRKRDGLFALMRCLPRRKENWPKLFMMALKESGNETTMRVLFGVDDTDGEDFDSVRIRQKTDDLINNDQPECPRTSRDGMTPVSQNNPNQGRPAYETSGPLSLTTPTRPVQQPVQEAAGPSTSTSGNILSMEVNFESHGETDMDTTAVAPGDTFGGNHEDDQTTGAGSNVPETFKLRAYQAELAGPGIEGKNSIVCAPTGSGKTHVALAITQSHLERAARGGKENVLFLVDTVHLMDQQLNVFKPHLPASCNPVGMSGSTDTGVGLAHMMKVSKVIVLTAQILLNSLEADPDHESDFVSISHISLLIFDECQNTTKKHCYNQIMKHYLEHKLNKTGSRASTLPQIVGLTASLGVGHASTTHGAVKHIEKVCANLDSTEICVVKENIEELREHVATPEMEMETVLPRTDDPCKRIISQHMEEIHARLKVQPELYKMPEQHKSKIQLLLQNIPTDFSSETYTQWCANLGKTVPIVFDQMLRKPFWTYHAHLKIYHDALNINAGVRTKDALEYMNENMSNLQTQGMKDDVDDWLEEKFREIVKQLKPISNNPVHENPLLQELRKKIISYSSKVDDCCGIIFVQTRAATKRLKSWMEEDSQLMSLKPDTIMGSEDMTQNMQIDVVKKFRDGKHKVLISTSVAEKGLDIQQCNWVIKYLHTTNEIALVQAKGRARKMDSRFGVVAPEASGKVEKEKLNLLREAMMNEAVDEVSRMKTEYLHWEEEILNIQKEELLRHKMEEREKKAQRPLMTDEYGVHCRKCDMFITVSSDLRVYQDTHYTSIRQDLDTVYDVKPHPKPVRLVDFEKTGKVHCKNCGLEWGIIAKLVGQEMPLLKPQGLVFVDVNGKRSIISKWKQFRYTIRQMDFNDMYNL